MEELMARVRHIEAFLEEATLSEELAFIDGLNPVPEFRSWKHIDYLGYKSIAFYELAKLTFAVWEIPSNKPSSLFQKKEPSTFFISFEKEIPNAKPTTHSVTIVVGYRVKAERWDSGLVVNSFLPSLMCYSETKFKVGILDKSIYEYTNIDNNKWSIGPRAIPLGEFGNKLPTFEEQMNTFENMDILDKLKTTLPVYGLDVNNPHIEKIANIFRFLLGRRVFRKANSIRAQIIDKTIQERNAYENMDSFAHYDDRRMQWWTLWSNLDKELKQLKAELDELGEQL